VPPIATSKQEPTQPETTLLFLVAELDLGRAQPKPSTEGRAREGPAKLNSRPRKRLAYKTSAECYAETR